MEFTMVDITVYTRGWCPYCSAAKELLTKKGAVFTEISIDGAAEQRDVMVERTGRTSVPQIFIGSLHVGGCDDLYALDAAGKLDPLLAA
jgi:glutaredoxin 3